MNSKKLKKGMLQKKYKVLNISDQKQNDGIIRNIQITDEIGSDKSILTGSDILISKLGMTRGYIFKNTIKDMDLLGSTEIIPYVNNGKMSTMLLKYILLHPNMVNSYSYMQTGKTPSHLRVNPIELLRVLIPVIPNEIQDKLEKEITIIEKNISKLEKMIVEPKVIINKVFADKFAVDKKLYNNEKNRKHFNVPLCRVAKNDHLRMSTHFHHVSLNKIDKVVSDKNKWIKLSKVFKLSGGKRIPKGFSYSNSNTDYRYLRPAEVDFGGIQKQELKYISKELYDGLKRYSIHTGDFCVSIVGTLGKVAYIDTKILGLKKDNLILSENFIKLKPKLDLNTDFMIYYLNSFLFEAQVNREYTITSVKKLGIDKWDYIMIPNLDEEEQSEIVTNIRKKLRKQKLIIERVNQERMKINDLINDNI